MNNSVRLRTGALPNHTPRFLIKSWSPGQCGTGTEKDKRTKEENMQPLSGQWLYIWKTESTEVSPPKDQWEKMRLSMNNAEINGYS